MHCQFYILHIECLKKGGAVLIYFSFMTSELSSLTALKPFTGGMSVSNFIYFHFSDK